MDHEKIRRNFYRVGRFIIGEHSNQEIGLTVIDEMTCESDNNSRMADQLTAQRQSEPIGSIAV